MLDSLAMWVSFDVYTVLAYTLPDDGFRSVYVDWKKCYLANVRQECSRGIVKSVETSGVAVADCSVWLGKESRALQRKSLHLFMLNDLDFLFRRH